MTEKERKASIAESASNYMRGRAMALSFKPLALGEEITMLLMPMLVNEE